MVTRPTRGLIDELAIATFGTPENLERAIEAIQAPARIVDEALQPLREAIHAIHASTKQIADALQAAKPAIIEILSEFVRVLEELPEREREAVLELGRAGWFVDKEMGWAWVVGFPARVKQGQLQETEAALCDHIDDQLSNIEHRVCSAFPWRARIIRDALSAHREERYALSVPVVLAQADGIAHEALRVSLYSRYGKGHTKVAREFEQRQIDPHLMPLLVAMTHVLPHIYNPAERQGSRIDFNRHAILHGESITYDTRETSARAISLLSYIVWMLEEIKTTRH